MTPPDVLMVLGIVCELKPTMGYKGHWWGYGPDCVDDSVSVFWNRDDTWTTLVSKRVGGARIQLDGTGATLDAAIASAADALCEVDGAHDALAALLRPEGGSDA